MKRVFALAIIAIAFHLTSVSVIADDLTISGNGSASNNAIILDQSSNTTITQNNNLDIENNVSQTANTGDNTASDNNDSTTIETGDVNTGVIVENSGNTSAISGDCCSSKTADNKTSVELSGNGSDSTNTADINNTHTTTINIVNQATIKNTVSGYANTGGNTANNNGGSVSITTGDISVEEQIINTNINKAGVSYTISPSGRVEIKVNDNGSGSVNSINLNNNTNQNISITNHADITNISKWFLNSGNNEAKGNLADVIISTGNIKKKTYFATFTNDSSTETFCCSDNPDYPNGGPENPDNHPNNPGNPTGGGNGGNGGGGGSTSGGQGGAGGSVLGISTGGEILPATGSFWTMWLTILAGILFVIGLYLRLNPGRAPNREFTLSF